tara:strand:+ start:20 stop:433 length:414 start_codon:yes stop_codon:yes gene_type:complete
MFSIRPAIILSLIVILSACQEDCEQSDLGCNELATKPEYSLLQAVESDLQDRPQDKAFLIIRNALSTDQTVIAFPKSSSSTGYVVLLADGEMSPKAKSVPDEHFTVSADALAELEENVRLSPEVAQYLTQMAEDPGD